MQKHLKKLCLTLSIAALTFTVSFKAPQLHNSYLRWEVGESVVQVVRPSNNFSGGTGFAVKGKSGQEYIMTNKHVCEIAEGGYVAIKKDGAEPVLKRVIYKDTEHDLCLVEGDSRLDAIEVGKHPSKGTNLYVVGHPGLRQLTVSGGEYIGYDIVTLLDEVQSRKDCHGKIVELSPMQQWFYGIEFACLVDYKSYGITAVVYGGNSGSPVVDSFGNVIGVLFAGSTQQERDNYAVPVSEVKRVLSKF
jgi:S1-C subfamily serine protease